MATAVDEVQAYPNPASGNLRVTLGKISRTASVVLRNANGVAVWNNTGNLLTGASVDINVSRLSAGVYFLQVTGDDMKATIKRIVVSK